MSLGKGNSGKKQLKTSLAWLVLGIVKALEGLGVAWPAFGRLYNHLFYKRMVLKEAQLAGLRKGQRILHIGSGPLPLTALSLAEAGFLIEGVDLDPAAVEKSTAMVKAFGFEDRITIRLANGLKADCSGYDAIWLSLHVFPKEEVLRNALEKLHPGRRLVYRNPRGWLTRFYPQVQPEKVVQDYPWQKTVHPLGKETVIIAKTGCNLNSFKGPIYKKRFPAVQKTEILFSGEEYGKASRINLIGKN